MSAVNQSCASASEATHQRPTSRRRLMSAADALVLAHCSLTLSNDPACQLRRAHDVARATGDISLGRVSAYRPRTSSTSCMSAVRWMTISQCLLTAGVGLNGRGSGAAHGCCTIFQPCLSATIVLPWLTCPAGRLVLAIADSWRLTVSRARVFLLVSCLGEV